MPVFTPTRAPGPGPPGRPRPRARCRSRPAPSTPGPDLRGQAVDAARRPGQLMPESAVLAHRQLGLRQERLGAAQHRLGLRGGAPHLQERAHQEDRDGGGGEGEDDAQMASTVMVSMGSVLAGSEGVTAGPRRGGAGQGVTVRLRQILGPGSPGSTRRRRRDAAGGRRRRRDGPPRRGLGLLLLLLGGREEHVVEDQPVAREFLCRDRSVGGRRPRAGSPRGRGRRGSEGPLP